ncbi:hypothetical protein CDAR_533411 [Caerostris darwini]|uniref:Uncharacterized protein n=1 Tax=Caerostris darwini TaxID=1538125 RepID=A0AAV4S6V3_9ARAC|nr:hypothetical protein CDAR_533411 [Caerostris darwini]
MDRRKFNPLCHIDHTTIKSHHSTPNDPASSLAFRAHRTHKSVIICNPFKLSQRSPPNPLLPQPVRGAQEVSQDFLPYKQKLLFFRGAPTKGEDGREKKIHPLSLSLASS